MFTRAITETDFTQPYADGLFPHIRGSSYGEDVSFLATLRAVLDSRMKEGESLDFHVLTPTDPELFAGPDYNIEAMLEDDFVSCDTFTIVSLTNAGEEAGKILEYVGDAFVKSHEGFSVCAVLKDFMSKTKLMEFCPIVHAKNHQAFVFVDSLDMRKYHTLQVGISQLLPWFFEGRPIRPGDAYYTLLKATSERTPEPYLAALNEIANMYADRFREPKLREQLGDFEKCFEKQKLQDMKGNLDRYGSDLDYLHNQFNVKLKQRNDLLVTYNALLLKSSQPSEHDGEVFDFFLHSRNLHLVRVSGENVQFVVTTYATNYDPETLETFLANPSSYIYSVGSDTFDEEARAKLLRALFIDETLKLRLSACYTVGQNGVYVNNDCEKLTTFEGYMINPHLKYYQCLGSYEYRINECIRDFDYVGGIATCVASTGSINFSDSPVATHLWSDLFSSRGKSCIELPDGTVVTPKRALVWLRKQEEATAPEEEAKTESDEVKGESDE